MRHGMGRFTLAAMAALIAISTAAPADAQRKRSGSVKLSKGVQTALAQAQPLLQKAMAAQQAGDQTTATTEARNALAYIEQAAAVENRTADDDFTIHQMRLNVGIITNDNAQLLQALEAGLASGKLPAEDQQKYLRNIGALSLQANDNARAMQAFEQLIALNPNDPQLLVEVAELHRRNNDAAKAVATLQQAITAQEAAGSKADESWYRRALAVAYDAKLPAQTVATSEALLRAYPNPTNWRDVLVIFQSSAKFDDQANLDIMRLMRTNDALAGERDYVEYADTAVLRGLPGEANAVLDEGIAKKALDPTKPFVKELKGAVAPRVASDRASLNGLAKESASAKDGRAAIGTGDAFLGYGEWARAAEMYRLALQKGNVDANAANTRLGLALGKSGDKAGAEAALNAVTGEPRTQLAKYYLIWLAQQN